MDLTFAIHPVPAFRSSCPVAGPPFTNSENHGHWQTYASSAAFDFKLLDGVGRLRLRNFKSAALARKLVKRERQIPNSTRILNLLVVF